MKFYSLLLLALVAVSLSVAAEDALENEPSLSEDAPALDMEENEELAPEEKAENSMDDPNDLDIQSLGLPAECMNGKSRISDVGDLLRVHLVGSIDGSSKSGEVGRVFEDSPDKSSPLEFNLGRGSVIKGLEEGLIGMCKGEKRLIIVPPSMGYDAASSKDLEIPEDATLRYEVELLHIGDNDQADSEEYPNIFSEMDTDSDNKITPAELAAWFKKDGEDVPEGLWETEDKDEDGVISFEEFGGPKGLPEELDNIDPELESPEEDVPSEEEEQPEEEDNEAETDYPVDEDEYFESDGSDEEFTEGLNESEDLPDNEVVPDENPEEPEDEFPEEHDEGYPAEEEEYPEEDYQEAPEGDEVTDAELEAPEDAPGAPEEESLEEGEQ